MSASAEGTKINKRKDKAKTKAKVAKKKTQAQKYRDRDAQEVFFRKKEKQNKAKRKATKKRKKKLPPKPKTNTERAAWARAHYHANHSQPQSKQHPPTRKHKISQTPIRKNMRKQISTTNPNIQWTPPQIMGHMRQQQQQQQQQQQDLTIAITPATVREMHQYLEELDNTTDQKLINKLFDDE